jgi:hypothetical protein
MGSIPTIEIEVEEAYLPSNDIYLYMFRPKSPHRKEINKKRLSIYCVKGVTEKDTYCTSNIGDRALSLLTSRMYYLYIMFLRNWKIR